jgi:hypothetical protein
MIIYGTALLAVCHLIGVFVGDLLFTPAAAGFMRLSILFLSTKAVVG